MICVVEVKEYLRKYIKFAEGSSVYKIKINYTFVFRLEEFEMFSRIYKVQSRIMYLLKLVKLRFFWFFRLLGLNIISSTCILEVQWPPLKVPLNLCNCNTILLLYSLISYEKERRKTSNGIFQAIFCLNNSKDYEAV